MRYYFTRRFVRHQGQALVEYALVMVLMGALAVGGLAQGGQRVAAVFQSVTTALSTSPADASGQPPAAAAAQAHASRATRLIQAPAPETAAP